MVTEERLKRKYLGITKASTDPEVHDRAYKQFLVGMYRLNGNQKIFQYLQAEPFQNGIEILFAYVLNQVTVKEAYQLTFDRCVKLYVKNLSKFKLIPKKVDSKLDKLCEEVALEAIKGANTLEKAKRRLHCHLKMSIKEKLSLRKQDHAAYIIWFNILEKLHKHLKLPPVCEFVRCFLPKSIEPVGQQILLGNDFSKFHLEEGELEYYRKLCR